MKTKRILIVTREIVPFNYGGIGTQFKSLATFLNKRGHAVAFLTEEPVSFSQKIVNDYYGDVGIYFVEKSSDERTELKALIYAENVLKAFDRLYETLQPDFVICADFEAEGFLLIQKSNQGCYGNTRFILTLNGMTYNVLSMYEGDCQESNISLLDQPHIRLICAIEDLCVLSAHEIVSPSRVAWVEVQNRLFHSCSTRVIPNFADSNLFFESGGGEVTGTGRSKIVFVGRLDRLKGSDLLLKAYLRLSQDPKVNLPEIVFIGRDCHWKAYEETFLGHWRSRIPVEVSQKITFTGHLEHQRIADYLRGAVFCVFPSRWEVFGIACLEAMGMGCPVLVPCETGLEEVVGSSFPEGLFTHDTDGHNLAERMRFLLDHPPSPDARRALRQRALQLNEQAEKGWRSLIETEIETGENHAVMAQWSGPILTLLSLLRQPKDHDMDHLQIYFSRKQNYEESDSIRVAYPGGRWETLVITMPGGTGDPKLRMDPSECSGTVLLRQVLLTDQQGEELWRSDASNRFRGIRFIGKGQVFLRSDSYVLHAADNDPQLLLDCPAVEKPVLMTVVLYAGAGEGDDTTVS